MNCPNCEDGELVLCCSECGYVRVPAPAPPRDVELPVTREDFMAGIDESGPPDLPF